MNKLDRSISKWTKACEKRLSRLISYIHHTCDYKQYCHVGNTAKQCRLGLFQDSGFARVLEDSKIHIRWNNCAFWEVIRLFQLAGCVRNKLQFRTVQQRTEVGRRHSRSHGRFQFLASILNRFCDFLVLRVNEKIPRKFHALSSFGFSTSRALAINDLVWVSTAVLSVSPRTTYIRLEVSLPIE